MAGDENLNQDDIEQLLAGNNAGGEDANAEPSPPSAKPQEAPQDAASDDNATLGQDDIESLLNGGAKVNSGVGASGDSDILGQNEIESLLNNTNGQNAPTANPAHTPVSSVRNVAPRGGPKNLFPEDGAINESDVEYLLNQAEEAIESIRNGKSAKGLPDGIQQFNFERFGGSAASTEMATLDMVKDVDLDLRIELGRTHMYLQDVLKLRSGSVVPLDKLAGDPVDIFVNGRLIAKGEVLVLNDNFCVRIAELIAGADAAG